MQEALGLARMGWGLTSPNPMVGAVVVRDGVIIGRGYHFKAGRPMPRSTRSLTWPATASTRRERRSM